MKTRKFIGKILGMALAFAMIVGMLGGGGDKLSITGYDSRKD